MTEKELKVMCDSCVRHLSRALLSFVASDCSGCTQVRDDNALNIYEHTGRIRSITNSSKESARCRNSDIPKL